MELKQDKPGTPLDLSFLILKAKLGFCGREGENVRGETIRALCGCSIAALTTAVGSLLGGWDSLLQVLLIFIAIDYLSGMAAAWLSKTLDSNVGIRGIVKKICLLMLVAVANLLDGVAFDGDPILRSATIYFYLANEGLSIMENSAKIGVPWPKVIRDSLLQLRRSAGEEDTEEEP